MRTADAYSCKLTVAPARIKRHSVGLCLFAGRISNRDDFVGPYYGKIAFSDLMSRHPTQKVYEGGVWEVDVARLSKYAL